jgi:hypothetical protein
MDKKTAKMDMLKELSKEMSDDQYSPLAEKLKGKKLQKVSVMSDSKEGLKKGLSKAEELLKMKGYGDSEEESEEGEEEESEEEASEVPEMPEMSEEQMRQMLEMLKAKLGE